MVATGETQAYGGKQTKKRIKNKKEGPAEGRQGGECAGSMEERGRGGTSNALAEQLAVDRIERTDLKENTEFRERGENAAEKWEKMKASIERAKEQQAGKPKA